MLAHCLVFAFGGVSLFTGGVALGIWIAGWKRV